MSFIGHTGKITGYNFDYLEKISEYTGWQIEYVTYSTADYNEAIGQAIEDCGRAGWICSAWMLKTSQSQDAFEFPENSYGTVYTTLCAPRRRAACARRTSEREAAAASTWAGDDPATRSSIIWKRKASSMSLCFSAARRNRKQALMNGEVDVISGLSLSPIANTRIVEQFAARPYYFAATKGDTELIKELDETIARIDLVQPQLQGKLYNKYFKRTEDAYPITEEQKKNVAAMKTLKVLCVKDDAPYVYEENGEAKRHAGFHSRRLCRADGHQNRIRFL